MNGQVDTKQTPRLGLTAIEILIVLAVFIALLLVAWPRFSQWRQTTLAHGLQKALNSGDRDGAIHYLKRGAPPDACAGSSPHFCLWGKVVRDNDIEMARLVFPPRSDGQSNVSPHSPPLLNMAVANDSVEMVAILLDAGADPKTQARYGLHKNVRIPSGEIEMKDPILRLLAAYRDASEPFAQLTVGDFTDTMNLIPVVVDLNRLEEDPVDDQRRSAWTRENVIVHTLLHDAVIYNNEAMLRLLLERGVDPDLTDEAGKTALDLACRLGRDRLTTILKEAGACTTSADKAGETPGGEGPCAPARQ